MGLFKELFRLRRYKVSQGRLIRRLTMAGVWVMFATAAWKCTLMDFTWVARWMGMSGEAASAFVPAFTFSMAGMILLFGLWFGWRLINWPTFGDFLIAVEAEMAKVSWPGRDELKSSTVVVLAVFLFLAGVLLIYDMILISIFKVVGIQ
ncbi:MAG: preprotein translocase subunit SecE [Planctomycetaceae bacterium]|nr:preprotein translocase subunit SecE [Planctomycetaceae bacterium]